MLPTERLYNYYDSKFQVSPNDFENIVHSSMNTKRKK